MGMQIQKLHIAYKGIPVLQNLCHNVGAILIGINFLNGHLLFFKHIFNPMLSHVDVFRIGMERRVRA